MKTIGLLGGMSWESTALYYRYINEQTKQQLGGLHSAKIVLVSVDFHEIEALQRNDDWKSAAALLIDAARRAERAGADFLLICTNTMHRVADEVEAAIGIPLLHLADATANAVKQACMKSVGLLGTRFTMEQTFYRERLVQHGLNVIIPSEAERDLVHTTIYEELCLGVVRSESRKAFIRIIEQMHSEGAEGIIEGCTEIAMLVKQSDTEILLFDTTIIHAREAVDFALH
ncbi:MAG: aspartate/glutamate racemase family protein [Gammaproteobacteria bacterium]|nr:aspartate/glutamate racemase family protein [Gammaproteobacteria bacterium]